MQTDEERTRMKKNSLRHNFIKILAVSHFTKKIETKIFHSQGVQLQYFTVWCARGNGVSAQRKRIVSVLRRGNHSSAHRTEVPPSYAHFQNNNKRGL